MCFVEDYFGTSSNSYKLVVQCKNYNSCLFVCVLYSLPREYELIKSISKMRIRNE